MLDHYITLLLILPLVFAAIIPFVSPGEDNKNVHFVGMLGAVLTFAFSALAWNAEGLPKNEIIEWMPSLGISYAVGTDGLSMTLVILTTFLLVMASAASITNITKRVKLYYSMLFILTTSVLGVFLARDLFLFFLFYELELIPMYLLIAVWGGTNRRYASTKFVLYTLFGSVFMLAAILGLYFQGANLVGDNIAGLFLFENLKIIAPTMLMSTQILVFLGFFIAFSVKLPVVPFHTWLPDAHVEAPTPVSMLLAGILLKMGAYGMLRFGYDLFPQAAMELAPWIALLAVINIVYTAGVALVQTDMKKVIAYSSVSHMGFVLLGLVAMNAIGFNGAVFVMFAHGIVSAALFMCVGTIYRRTHTRMIGDLGGLGAQTPTLFYFFLFFSMASLGLPLLVSFASESLVFYGAFTANTFTNVISVFGLGNLIWNMQTVTILSAIGVVIGAAYLLWLVMRVFHGNMPERWLSLKDATLSEVFVLGTLACLTIAYGFFPRLITDRFEPVVTSMASQYTVFQQQKPDELALMPSSTVMDDEAIQAVAIEEVNEPAESLSPQSHPSQSLMNYVSVTTASEEN